MGEDARANSADGVDEVNGENEPDEASVPAAEDETEPSLPDAPTPGYRPAGIDDAFAENRGAQARGTGAPVVASIGFTGMLRFMWRQLTSMRIALMLLMLLAVAAVPGSILPQESSDPAGYARYVAEHADLSRWLDRFQLFDVYTSVWFSAIYILLFVSLVGCILPRTRAHLRGLGTRPPRAPRRFTRLPAAAAGSVAVDQAPAAATPARDTAPAATLERARTYLVGRFRRLPRYRIETAQEPDGALTLSAERGYLRETGNLLFHLALVGLLISVALGQLLHYRGQVLVVQGRGFANAEVHYDTFEHGAWFEPDTLDPFTLTLDDFESKFRSSDAQAQDFTAHVTLTDRGRTTQDTIKVNHPLDAGGAKVYLQGNGYAPIVSVTDSDGEVAFAGAVPFIPQDGVYTSQGTIKVPDVTSGDQIGLVGYLLPTAQQSGEGWVSVFPQPYNPVLVLSVWSGDLGLDDGVPQNVYELDTDNMVQAIDDDGQPVSFLVSPGESVDLPDGLGTFTFQGLDRYVALDLRHDPALGYILVFAFLALGGLALSLFVPRRRVWVRVRGTEVEVGGLARSEDTALGTEVARVLAAARGVPFEMPDDEDDDVVAEHDDTVAKTDADAATEAAATSDQAPTGTVVRVATAGETVTGPAAAYDGNDLGPEGSRKADDDDR